jgi:pimeloyl-ACP methyl ester carboxylesterase
MEQQEPTSTLLAHERITSGGTPERWMFFVHGFLGKGQNWRSFARRLVERKPAIGAVLVDMRLHGNSRGMKGPHTLAAAANDIILLRATFAENVTAILGHSFGAKVVLKFLELDHGSIDSAWLVDFTPWRSADKQGASQTIAVLNLLSPLVHESFTSREAFIAALEKNGLPCATAQWLSMN